MITSTIGKKLPNIDGNANIVRLKSKGEKIKFRLASGNFSYVGKHYIQCQDGSWEITECPRIMKQEECILCDKFFDAKRVLKMDETNKEAKADEKKYNPSIEFYYWIIDREDSQLKVLQTTTGVRGQIDMIAKDLEEQESSIFAFDLQLTRTEKAGSYYVLDRVDSSLTQELTEEEKAKVKEAEETDVATVVKNPVKKTSNPIMNEDVNPFDDNFEELT